MMIDSEILDKISRLTYLQFEDEEKEKIRQERMSGRISHDEALLNVPEKSDGFFKVPKVINK
jgi:Asp-tRNA(Asn)/Glu-tRNA(Gln) amidotransferase C subunit